MNLTEIANCPGTLAEGYNTYSPLCLKNMFNKKKVSPILPYEAPHNEEVEEQFIENRKRISLSGDQEKLSMVLEKNQLRLTHPGEQGTYILKPIPRDLKKVDQVPANEHLTMQIARQVYGIKTAENALIFFKDGTPAYLTKRFDVKEDGTKWGKEDFASLAGQSTDSAGPNFKYDYNYEALGLLFHEFVPAWRIEIEKYFVMVLFNYLFSNGDAHLKNFALLESASGDYLLSPAYDLINTRLHVDDTDFALSNLFEDKFQSGIWKIKGHASAEDFREFGRRVGVQPKRIDKLLAPFLSKQEQVESLISRSFLNEPAKRGYLMHYQTKRNYLNG